MFLLAWESQQSQEHECSSAGVVLPCAQSSVRSVTCESWPSQPETRQQPVNSMLFNQGKTGERACPPVYEREQVRPWPGTRSLRFYRFSCTRRAAAQTHPHRQLICIKSHSACTILQIWTGVTAPHPQNETKVTTIQLQ